MRTPAAGPILALSALAFLAPSAAAQVAPETAATLGMTRRDVLPLSFFDVRLDERGLPVAEVEQSKRAAFDAATTRARALEIERLAFDVPMLRVAEHELFATPQWIGSTVKLLTPPSELAPRDVVATFVAARPALFEIGPAELLDPTSARLYRDYATAHNGVRHLGWQQTIDGLDLVGCVLLANVARDGELINVSSSMLREPAGGFEIAPARLGALEALRAAAEHAGAKLASDPEPVAAPFSGGASGTTEWTLRRFPAHVFSTERVLFPRTRTRVVPAWRVVVPRTDAADVYEVIVDASTGELLRRKNDTQYLAGTESLSFRVYTSDSPAPGSPGPATPNGQQFPTVARSLVTVTAASVAAWSPNGWVDDGVNQTLGNNVDAHTDLDGNNVADVPRPSGAPYRVFDFAQDNAQAPSAWRPAAVAQFFYLANRYHDALMALGFDEAAKNFQALNFGGQGVGGDAVQADVQDGGGVNNANFATTGGDGTSARCQMYVFAGPNPDRDGDLDADIVFHEMTHGVSIRLHDGTVTGVQSKGMGEGWSDFFALSMNAEPADDPNAVYTIGAYTTFALTTGFTNNYYFGIRRFPYSTDLAKNPLTFADIDTAQVSFPPSVPRSAIPGGSAAEEHNVGEVWCTTLWEARANMIAAQGFAANQAMLQLVVDGMKLSVNNPSFLDARDAILQADLVDNSGTNLPRLWQAFAKRGLGASATSPSGSTSTGVVEAFDVPTLLLFTYPHGKPASLVPFQPTTFDVQAVGLGGQSLVPSSGELHVSLNGGPFAATSMTETAPGLYRAVLPPAACFDTLRWYVSVAGASSTAVDPPAAPAASNPVTAYTGVDVVLTDAFETNTGWIGGVAGDTATSGQWVRGDPIGTSSGGVPVQPEDDHSTVGTMCWVTGQGSVGGGAGLSDVDNGFTTLLSPVLDLSTVVAPRIAYWRWYSNNSSTSNPNADVMRVDISNDGGATWVNAETVGPATENGGGWIRHEIEVALVTTPTANVRLRFVAEDAGGGSVVEAAIDDLQVLAARCDPTSASFCAGDGTLSTPCPCGNTGASGRGCASSVEPNGALLVASGATNLDTIVLQASGLPATASCVFLQGDVLTASGAPFGDGVRCIDGTLVRLQTKIAAGGAVLFPDVGDPSVSLRGFVTPGSGAIRAYQAYYRNVAPLFCPPEGFNVTNGWKLVW